MASALRAAHAASGALLKGRSAVVSGGTSGIGEGLALRLASLGASVHILGRSAERGAEVLAQLRALNPEGSHGFSSVDAFSLPALTAFARGYVAQHASLDILAMSQGMATLQGFTPTKEGLDQKLTLHFYGRMVLARELLPSLRRGTEPYVLSVLSAGVHSGIADWASDPALQKSYSIKRAADLAGFYNDLGLDALSRQEGNSGILFVHGAPGFVATRWGTEMPWAVRMLVRGLQFLGKSPADCAEFMLRPIFRRGSRAAGGFELIGETGELVQPTAQHTAAAREGVWAHTVAVLDGNGLR